MRVDVAVVGGKRAATDGAANVVVLGGVFGWGRLQRLLLFGLNGVERGGNGIGEDGMAMRKEATAFADQSNQAFSAAQHCLRESSDEMK